MLVRARSFGRQCSIASRRSLTSQTKKASPVPSRSTDALPPITLLGAPVLRQECVPLELSTLGRHDALFDRLISVLRAHAGLGLAAPQLGAALRVFAFHPFAGEPHWAANQKATLAINPKITRYSKQKQYDLEVCLSIPGYGGLVERAADVDVEYHERTGTFVRQTLTGMPARVFQHELDHLNGVLYLDHLPHWQKFLLRHVDEWRRALRENPNAIDDAVAAEFAVLKIPR